MFAWLTSQDVFEIKDEIEEVNRKMLEKLLDENDFVAVYFCKKCYILKFVVKEKTKISHLKADFKIFKIFKNFKC